jgi:hypothetical protein
VSVAVRRDPGSPKTEQRSKKIQNNEISIKNEWLELSRLSKQRQVEALLTEDGKRTSWKCRFLWPALLYSETVWNE